MPARRAFDYAVVRVVPRVEREEFVNAGVILHCVTERFLGARVELDEARLRALAPGVDLALVRRHLGAIERICAGEAGAGPIARLPQKERFHWLTAPRSTIIQTSPVHPGMCEGPREALERLMQQMVRPPAG